MSDTYKITAVNISGEVRNTRYKGMTCEDADKLAGDIRFSTDGNNIIAALQVVRESDGEVYSEWEW